MNPNENSEITVATLLALREENDPVRAITERLKVREMGPADHIRTKHEAKAFVESGDLKAAEALIEQAGKRTAAHQAVTNRITERQQRGQRLNE